MSDVGEMPHLDLVFWRMMDDRIGIDRTGEERRSEWRFEREREVLRVRGGSMIRITIDHIVGGMWTPKRTYMFYDDGRIVITSPGQMKYANAQEVLESLG